jgi:hypothetical protein
MRASKAQMTRPAISVLLAATLCSTALAEVTAPTAPSPTMNTSCLPPARQKAEEGPTHAHIEQLLGPGALVRAFARFTTERDEPGVLVLYAERAAPPETPKANPTPPEQRMPRAPVHHIALLINDGLVNDIRLPDVPASPACAPEEPLGFESRWDLPQEAPARLPLMDLNGNTHAWGFGLRHCGLGVGRWYLLLAGYSARQRKVVVYPVIQGDQQFEWYVAHAYFPPKPEDGPVTLTAYRVCGEQGATTGYKRKFTYNVEREAWVMTEETITHCEQEVDEAGTRQQLQALLGGGEVVRDFARFTTERGEAAMLVVYLTEAEEHYSGCYDEYDPQYGPYNCDYDGVTWLQGTYWTALVIGNKVINRIKLPPHTQLPLTGFHGLNHDLWGQGDDCMTDNPCYGQIERTKVVKLLDYNGEGHPWEFRLVRYEMTGHEDTVLVGYSARQRKVIVYPVFEGNDRHESYDNFFPSPNAPDARVVHYHTDCGAHGSEIGNDRDFAYNPEQEAWVMTWEQEVDCSAVQFDIVHLPSGGDPAVPSAQLTPAPESR